LKIVSISAQCISFSDFKTLKQSQNASKMKIETSKVVLNCQKWKLVLWLHLFLKWPFLYKM